MERPVPSTREMLENLLKEHDDHKARQDKEFWRDSKHFHQAFDDMKQAVMMLATRYNLDFDELYEKVLTAMELNTGAPVDTKVSTERAKTVHQIIHGYHPILKLIKALEDQK